MAAVTYEFYIQDYIGEPITEEDFPRYAARAEDAVNQLIHFREVPAKLQKLYQKAICAQIEYYAANGIDLAAAGISSSGFTVGKVSVSGGSSVGMTGAISMVAPAARAYLEQTGLMAPAVGVIGPVVQLNPWGCF